MYSQKLIVNAFKYFATSHPDLLQSAQNGLSITVHKNTYKCNIEIISFKWNSFYAWHFQHHRKKPQTVCEMQDETYVKNFVSSWGTLFGRATDNLKSLAKNILRVILKD